MLRRSPTPSPSKPHPGLSILYEDPSVIVVNKPSGLLSVPGRSDAPSVQSLLSDRFGKVYMPHRLDQDTSGLMVVARNMDAYRNLQRQFAEHTIVKRYIAVVSLSSPTPQGDGAAEASVISLPLRPDPFDRPRQVVDPVHGKPAVTRCEVLAVEGHIARLALTPLTGRTHQLRVHCAHPQGLGAPIIGDRLYGLPVTRTADGDPSAKKGESTPTRLCLHAARLTFRHPVSGKMMTFNSKAPF